MRNPHYNKLKKPLVMPVSMEKYMMSETIEMLEMWTNYQKHGIKPWDISGRITNDDINMLSVIEQIYKDGQKYQETMSNTRQAESEIIANRKKMGY